MGAEREEFTQFTKQKVLKSFVKFQDKYLNFLDQILG